MLTQVAKTTTIAVVANKQIALQAVTGSVMYEVPSGRKFVGVVTSTGNYQVSINGVQVLSNSSAVPPYLPIELCAGSKVTSGSSYQSWSLIGVETNA